MARCKNEFEQTVPKGIYDYKLVKAVCGQTGYYGKTIYCADCERTEQAVNGVKRKNLEQNDG